MNILVLGEHGQLATYLRTASWPQGVSPQFIGREGLNLTDRTAIRPRMSQLAPDLVINAAAFTAVDDAERQQDLAFAINATAPAEIAAYCREAGTRLIHVSTDYVFDGTANHPYREAESTNPINVYGASKLAGEQAIFASGCHAIVLRTSWLFGAVGETFVAKILKRAQKQGELSVIGDQLGCPTFAGDLAAAIVTLAANKTAEPGLFHFAGSEILSWHGFARRILQATHHAGWPEIPLHAVTSDAFKTAARRPAFSALDSTKAISRLGLSQGSLDVAIRTTLDRLLPELNAQKAG